MTRTKNPAAVALGSLTSKKKAMAARENGKNGGRPERDYHAKVVIYGLPTMGQPEIIAEWLRGIATNIEASNTDYAAMATFRYMKPQK